MDDYSKHTSSTYAITKFTQDVEVEGLGKVKVDLWDTAGQVISEEIIFFNFRVCRNGLRHFIRVSITALTWRFLCSIRHASSHIETYRILGILN